MSNILITGMAKVLASLRKEELEKQGHSIIDYNLEDGNDVRTTKDLIMWENIDVLINNAGVNLIDWLENFEEDMDKVMDTNAKGIYMMTQACLPSLIRRKGTILNIVSNAAHMPMTCSLAYNASKGASTYNDFAVGS